MMGSSAWEARRPCSAQEREEALMDTGDSTSYQRQREWLLTARRHSPLTENELQESARALYGDADHFHLLGVGLEEVAARGLVILGRTCVEACIDEQAVPMAEALQRMTAGSSPLILDLFAGSGNLLYHAVRHLQAPGCGFEIEAAVYSSLQHNLKVLGHNLKILNRSWREAWEITAKSKADLIVALVDPPWGPAYDYTRGLDLRRTNPSVLEVLQELRTWTALPILCLIKTADVLANGVMDEIRSSYTIVGSGMSQGMETGFNIGYLICQL
jgi:Conserved hypothetical protein 95